ncbi:MAG: sugar phosphate isomerase/epimerase [Planctomycetaceae bacterium]|nr:sugar phosphate isomerase/epimerase [Planctomycetaceae bacterium]
MKMRLSYFGFAKDIDDIDKAGYDCIEMHIKEVMAFSQSEYEEAKRKLKGSGITAEVFDNPLPLDKVVASPDFDWDFYVDFLKKAVERTAAMGARYYVYGNGKTRSSRPGSTEADDIKKNEDMLATLCELAAQANITILLEPLAKSLSTRWLGVPENFAYAKQSGIPNLKTLIDYRWFLEEKHPISIIEEYADFIQHVHIDNPLSPFPTRIPPAIDDGHDYGPLFDALKKTCYKGILSIEANTTTDFPADLKRGLDLIASHGIEAYRS